VKVFAAYRRGEYMNFSEEEIEILQNWGFLVSTERPLSDEEKELYFKITKG
jgi:hypothetical protein